MENITISLESLASVLGTSHESLSESLKADGKMKPDNEIVETIKGFASNHFKKIKSDNHNEGFNRAKKEVLSSKEKELKAKFELSDDFENFDGLIEAIVSKQSAKNKMNPEDVRNSEHYKNDIKSWTDKYSKIKSEYEQFKNNVQTEKTNSIVSSRVKSILENVENKYVLPENETIRSNHFKSFMGLILGDNVKFGVNESTGAIDVMDKDGNLLRDDMQQTLDFDGYIQRHAKGFYQVAQGDQRKGTGNQTQGGTAGSGNHNFNITSSEDYMRQYTAEKDAKVREAMKAHYENLVSKNLIQ